MTDRLHDAHLPAALCRTEHEIVSVQRCPDFLRAGFIDASVSLYVMS